MTKRKPQSMSTHDAAEADGAQSAALPVVPHEPGNGNGSRVDVPGLDRVLDVKVRVSVELGRRRISLAEVLSLGPGALIEFAKPAHEPLDVLVNDQLVARGQPVVMGERYGVRITEVVSPKDRLQSSGVVKEVVA